MKLRLKGLAALLGCASLLLVTTGCPPIYEGEDANTIKIVNFFDKNDCSVLGFTNVHRMADDEPYDEWYIREVVAIENSRHTLRNQKKIAYEYSRYYEANKQKIDLYFGKGIDTLITISDSTCFVTEWGKLVVLEDDPRSLVVTVCPNTNDTVTRSLEIILYTPQTPNDNRSGKIREFQRSLEEERAVHHDSSIVAFEDTACGCRLYPVIKDME